MEPKNDERDDEQGRGAEHPDLVLRGEEEHPLRFPLLELELHGHPDGLIDFSDAD